MHLRKRCRGPDLDCNKFFKERCAKLCAAHVSVYGMSESLKKRLLRGFRASFFLVCLQTGTMVCKQTMVYITTIFKEKTLCYTSNRGKRKEYTP